MFDLIGAGISIVSGIMGKKSADKESKAAKRQANNEAAAAKAIGASRSKYYTAALDRNKEQYKEQKASVYRERDAALQSLSAQSRGELAAIDLKYQGAIKAHNITKESFSIDRQGNGLMSKAFREQEKQDLIQIQLGADEQEMQLNENIRAAQLQADYKRLAARRSLEKADTDVKDYKRAQHYESATARAMSAASGVQREGSPMKVENARMTEMMIGASRIMQEGDENFMAHMQEVNEINQYIHGEKESKDFNRIAAYINKSGVKDRTKLELEGNKLALKTIGVQEQAANEDLDIATKAKNISVKTANELYAANKSIVKADASSAKSALLINRRNTAASLSQAKTEASKGASSAISQARATGVQRSNAAQSAGMSSLVGGVGGALKSIENGSTLKSLSSRGGGGSWSLFR